MGRRDLLPHDSLVGIHVLVVDDDPDALELLQTVLAYCGALVTVSRSATEALATRDRITPDVILTDIAMPHHDGYWLSNAVRQRPGRGGTLPIVAITAHGEQHGPERTLDAGFQGHLRKPLDPWELCRALSSVVRRS